MIRERLKLTVTETGEPRLVGTNGVQKLSFRARNADGRDLPYFTFSPRLFPYVKAGALDAEVETETKETAAGSFTDRKVTQVYDNGMPVLAVAPSAATQIASRPDATASIEAQTAAKIGCELLVAGRITLADSLGRATMAWCLSRLGGKPEGRLTEPIPEWGR